MRIWIITVGEPLPVDGKNVRYHRSMLLANTLAERGNEVVFWSSTFDHVTKTHRFLEDTRIKLSEKYELYLMKGPGYKKNISFERLKDHQFIAKRFRQLAVKMEKPDVILSSLPTIELSDEAALFGKNWNIPVILDMRDMWPDIFVNLLPGPFRPVLKKTFFARLFRQMYRACTNATAITGITPGFVKWGLGYAKRPASADDRDFPFGYNENGITDTDLAIADEYWDNIDITKDKASFNICLFSNMGRVIDMATIASAARKLSAAGLPHKFIICGDGDMWETFKKMAEDCSNVIFTGRVDAARIKTLMGRSQIGILPYRNEADFMMSIPNKPIEYMSGGLPVISCLHGTVGELLQEENCGVIYHEDNPGSLFDHLAYLHANRDVLADMSQRAYAVYQKKFMANKVYNDMSAYLEGFVGKKGSKGSLPVDNRSTLSV